MMTTCQCSFSNMNMFVEMKSRGEILYFFGRLHVNVAFQRRTLGSFIVIAVMDLGEWRKPTAALGSAHSWDSKT